MHTLHLVDFAIIIIYLSVVVLMGWYFSKRQKSVQDFCLAGRKMGWFPLAVSILATGVSAISLVGVPTYIFRENLQLTATNLLFSVPLLLFVGFMMIPVLYKLRIYTVYEYLERRFHPSIRTAASIVTILMRLAWLATVIYVPALMLSPMTGMPLWLCIFIIGLSTTAYTVAGGLEAVIWTDVLQFFVMVFGLLAVIIFMLREFDWNVASIWKQAVDSGSTRMFDFSFSFRREATFWAVLSGMVVATLGMFGTDQVIVQRCFAAKDTKSAIASMVGYSLINFPFTLLLIAIGLGLAAFFHANPAQLAELVKSDADPSKALEKAFPFYIINHTIIGIPGLIIAMLLAVTMSTISGAINSLATMLLKDVIEPFFPAKNKTKHSDLTLTRLLTFAFGMIATVTALFVGNIGTILQVFGLLSCFIAAPLYGVFFLGLFTKRANTFGIICGSIVSYVVCPVCYFIYDVNWVWLGGINTFIVMLVGWIASLLYNPRCPTQKFGSSG